MGVSDTGPVARAPSTLTRPASVTTKRVILGLQIAIALVAVGAALIGWSLFATEPAIWVLYGRWMVKELVPGVVVFAVAGVLLLRFREAVVVGWTMLGCALSCGLSALAAGLFLVSFERGWTSVDLLYAASFALQALGLHGTSFCCWCWSSDSFYSGIG